MKKKSVCQRKNISDKQVSRSWAARDIPHSRGFRTAPSAGALYPLEMYIGVGKVTVLGEGIYKYDPEKLGFKEILICFSKSCIKHRTT